MVQSIQEKDKISHGDVDAAPAAAARGSGRACVRLLNYQEGNGIGHMYVHSLEKRKTIP